MIDFLIIIGITTFSVAILFSLFGFPLRYVLTRQHTWQATILWLVNIVLLLVWQAQSNQFNDAADMNGTTGDLFYAWPLVVLAVAFSLTAQMVAIRAQPSKHSKKAKK